MDTAIAMATRQAASPGEGPVRPPRAIPHFEGLPGSDLPVFKGRGAEAVGDVWYYAPGYLSLVPPGKSRGFEADVLSASGGDVHASELRRHAAEAHAAWEA